jgi:hypothetical protein
MKEIDYIIKELEYIENKKVKEIGDKVYRFLVAIDMVYDSLNKNQQETINKIIFEIYAYKRKIKKSYHSAIMIRYMYYILFNKYRLLLIRLLLIGLGKDLEKDVISNSGLELILKEIKDL